MAIEPGNASLRNDFAHALSVEVLGSRGAAILAYLLIKLASKPQIVEREVIEVADKAEVLEFLALVLEQFKKGTTIVVGTGRLPDTFTKERATRLVPVLPEVVRRMLDEISDDDSFQVMTMALHASLLACDRAGDRVMAAALLRMAAIHLASSGRPQAARDMAEHGLSMAGTNPDELRVAWATFSDVYHRIGNIDEALVGALLLTSIEGARVGTEEAWLEGHLLTRLLRDLGLFDDASAALASAATLFANPSQAQKVRFESIRLSIEERRFERGPASDGSLLRLIGEFATNLNDAVRVEDDVLPPLVFLLQLRARAKSQGLTVANETDDVIDRAMKLVPPNLRDRIAAYGAPRPSITELETLARGVSKTKFAADVAYDIQHLGLLAKRALARSAELPTSEALCLLDLLTDRGIVDLDGRALIDPTRATNAVGRLIRDDHDVYLMAFDERDRLVRLTYSPRSAETITIEPSDVFDRDRFSDWKSEFPFRYAFMDSDADVRADLVRRSVDGLGISRMPDRSTVFVCDVALQAFPMNLLRHQQDFVGALVPVSSAPSLDWLSDTASRPYSPNGRCIAWVSDGALDVQVGSVLGPLADRLEPLLTERDATLVRAETPPPELKAADIAIVVAHGGLVPEQRFFQVLRDDHNRQWTPREIVRAIGSAGVVVLFVCSSGRLDEHPRGRATVGLARRLLANGCRGIVACPWPLAVAVPPRWLPHFLDSVNAGDRVCEAVFRANQEMLTFFSGNPPHALAMHFYGDPTFRLK